MNTIATAAIKNAKHYGFDDLMCAVRDGQDRHHRKPASSIRIGSLLPYSKWHDRK